MQFNAKVSYINTSSQRKRNAAIKNSHTASAGHFVPEEWASLYCCIRLSSAKARASADPLPDAADTLHPEMLWSSTAVRVMYSFFLHRQHSLACTVSTWLHSYFRQGKHKAFFRWMNLCVELTQSCCLGADTERKIVANMWSSAHKAFDVTIKKLWKELASPPNPLLSSTHIAMDSCVLQSQLSAVLLSSDCSTIQYYNP